MSNAEVTPGPGHNEAPDAAQKITEQMAKEYAELGRNVDAQVAEAAAVLSNALPEPSEEEGDAAEAVALQPYVAAIKTMRDTTGRIEAYHKKEKEYFLRGGQGVDGYFFGLWERVARRVKTSKPGASDRLQQAVDDFMQRKRMKVQAKRDRIERLAQQEAVRKRQEAEAEAEKVREAERSAARARAPVHIEAKTELAKAACVVADTKHVDALIAEDTAAAARLSSKAKASDMTRTRTEGGGLATMGRENYAVVIDFALLPPAELWGLIPDAVKERAVRDWAKLKGYKEQLPGAEIGSRSKTVIR